LKASIRRHYDTTCSHSISRVVDDLGLQNLQNYFDDNSNIPVKAGLYLTEDGSFRTELLNARRLTAAVKNYD